MEALQTRIEACAAALDTVRDLLAFKHTPMEIRAAIDSVKTTLEAFEINQAFLQHYEDRLLTHHFANGLYAREAILEKGTIGVTAIHEEENISVMIKGKLGIVTEDKGAVILEGPAVFKTPSGTRRLIFVMEDAIFVTVHPNPQNSRDTAALIARITAKDFNELADAFESVSSICGGEA